ncbi:hypothetical protein [Maridesulfovibrio sp.]|uniref:hypothetical protein n=1 Tax=Maridesulfovibrio sp. TaxID=2795000 RepID=UPI0029CA4F62|nr:hypothetical protein [Maridesulfovibrio sp.]
MKREHEDLKLIYIGYHPRSNDGSSPRSLSHSDAIEVMDDFNKKQGEGNLRAEVVEIAFSGYCAVAVMETTVNKVWQYL